MSFHYSSRSFTVQWDSGWSSRTPVAAFGLCFAHMLDLSNILLLFLFISLIFILFYSVWGCKMAQLKEVYQVLGSIHHQFTLRVTFHHLQKYKWTLIWETQLRWFRTSELCCKNRPINELQALLPWRGWRVEVRG